jgi:hypothetical protein
MVSSTLALAAKRMREKTKTISGRIEKYALQEEIAGANLVWVWGSFIPKRYWPKCQGIG